jgi:hypothetical protein
MKHLIILEILQEAASEFLPLAAPQRELETSIQPLKKPTANHLPVILKRNTETPLQSVLNFSPLSLAYGTSYRITGSFLNAATSILIRVSVRIFKIITGFLDATTIILKRVSLRFFKI